MQKELKDHSPLEGVVAFNEGQYEYQAIRRGEVWDMAKLDGKRVVDVRDVHARTDATPGTLLAEFWKEQKKAGTYKEPIPPG